MVRMGRPPKTKAEKVAVQKRRQAARREVLRTRRAKGWSQARLAEELHVDPSLVSHWEGLLCAPSAAMLERIRALRVAG